MIFLLHFVMYEVQCRNFIIFDISYRCFIFLWDVNVINCMNTKKKKRKMYDDTKQQQQQQLFTVSNKKRLPVITWISSWCSCCLHIIHIYGRYIKNNIIYSIWRIIPLHESLSQLYFLNNFFCARCILFKITHKLNPKIS